VKNPEAWSVTLETGGSVSALTYAADKSAPEATLVLAHGAGAGQHSAFMVEYARALATQGIDVVTFNFPYIEQGRRVPDRRPVLESCYRRVLSEARQRVGSSRRALFIGGKSMGGRMATYLATDQSLEVNGLVLLGYPLHPPGKPAERRDAHLPDVHRAILIVQGSRDVFGTPAELAPVIARMSPAPTLHVIEGGDHSFKAPGGKAAQIELHARIQRTIADWIRRLSADSGGTLQRPD
jgi:predicted alpha/beta-hydrolase family hydrolase